MDDLADELRMSKKTFYAHFASKTELLRAVLLDKFNQVDADLTRLAERSQSSIPTALQQLLACTQNHTAEIQPALIRDIRREAPEMFLLVQERRRDIIQRHFGRLFTEGRKAGIIRKDIPTRLLIEILLSAIEAIVNPAQMAEFDLTPKTGISAVIRVVLTGVITEKGRSKI